ncbi:bifunctional molybdenum cofactor biosynthesis protein MoaC/MoaB [Flavobacteriaceae bacterium]|nr:bifunctional molybdenum cofactor biosynthesis protein MoaC/MoaB [Flavobacteriaceae bacterium]MDC0916322.1 bifunctional molybdenum cofactor biosynthesis protein MoaC/MoaB [Flavobacteriaceae bacterium]MDC3329443.1 bifunctional molybdenum cofactor biosynthesis protein MoaC/MoaB [Flavobacteriaceae bacterium]
MVDITHKKNTLREATAQALVRVSAKETIEAIQNKCVPKGDVFEISRAAGLLGVKKTPDLLPDCHPLPLEYTHFEFNIKGLEIQVLCTLKTIYKTGVEVEAMHGASIVALNMYDMLKPIDKGVEIHQIKLLRKIGGKTDVHEVKAQVNATVVVCSDSVAAGKKEDQAGKALQKALQKWNVTVADYLIIPDEINLIQATLKEQHKKGHSLIVFTGGTGLSPRDGTPEALQPLLDKTIPGMEEAIRNYGQNRTPYAMLSRSVVGMVGSSLVLALPGSTKGAEESLNAIFPEALHLFDIIKGAPHKK